MGESEVIVDSGENGKVTVKATELNGSAYINANTVQIKNNVLLKLKQSTSASEPNYIAANGVEMPRDKLMQTIGADAEIWYTDKDNKLQKIVHGKNVCTKKEIGRKDATCTEDGWVKYGCTYESDRYATAPEHNYQWTETIPATGHRWGEWVEDTAAGTRTRECSVCHATETEPLPSDTNSALELRVVDAEGMDQPFTVSQNGTLRTYTGAYDTATLTGDLDTLRYLQDHGAQTIQFVTNGQTSSFAISDLLAQGSGSEVFYLTHRGAEEPTLLLVEADHSELVKD